MQGYKVKEKTAIVPHSAALNPTEILLKVALNIITHNLHLF
jgi:hypothetical protein